MQSESASLADALNKAPFDLFHLRAMVTAGMGFFTDAYDLFIIGVALVLIKQDFHPSPVELSLVSSTALISAFVGAFIFGPLADRLGRKTIYGLEALIMTVGALLSAFAPNIIWLIIFRFILGIGIGGDYPVSAVLMSEYANTKDRGRLVGMVFSMQALGTIIGPVVAVTLLATGISPNLAWRIMLGLGALPALAVIYFRRSMPESPRYLSQVRGQTERAAVQIAQYSKGIVRSTAHVESRVKATIWNRRFFLTLLGTAGTWFVFDYAYYGNTISTPLIIGTVAPHATLIQAEAWTLILFAVAAVPGYVLAFLTMDRIGHRRLQLIGFTVMGLCFLGLGVIPGITRVLLPFIVLYAVSYFFAEFGPNTTTFVLSAELYPVNLRTTGHGLSAGIAKLGAFIGAFVFPLIVASAGLSGTLTITFVFAVVGILLTLLLPEPAGKSLEQISHSATDIIFEADEQSQLAPLAR